MTTAPVSVVRVGVRTTVVLALASAAGLAMFLWPLFAAPPPAAAGHSSDAPLMFVLILPVLVAVALAELNSGGWDAKTVALLGVLAAVNAALRPLGAGTGGIETVFFLLILGGRVFGPGFGFVLGATSLFASALLTAGVGPWLPFQILVAAWIGMGAGLLPRLLRGRWEVAMLAGYGVIAAYVYGALMNMWFWPFAVGLDTGLSYVPGDSLLANLHRFALFTMVTSTLGWDTGRAITNLVAISLAGPAVLAALRRAARRAAFDSYAVPSYAMPSQAPDPGSDALDPGGDSDAPGGEGDAPGAGSGPDGNPDPGSRPGQPEAATSRSRLWRWRRDLNPRRA